MRPTEIRENVVSLDSYDDTQLVDKQDRIERIKMWDSIIKQL